MDKQNPITLNRLLVILVFTSNCVWATTWYTQSYGYWNNGTTWVGGIAPPHTSNNTIIIQHAVIIENTITLNNLGQLYIDSIGGICGHQKITVNTGANITKYGILELDSLHILGGIVNCFAPGAVIISTYGLICCGGSVHNIGNALSVGPWFDCKLPEYTFAYIGINELAELPAVTVYPNPFENYTTLKMDKKISLANASLKVVDVVGNVVSEVGDFQNEEIKLERKNLNSGIYFYCLNTADGLIYTGKLRVE